MTHTLVLAATHGSSIPSPVTIVLAIAAVVWVLWSRTKGQPLKAKRLLVLPVVLTVIGVTDLSGSSAPHLTPTDIAFLAASVVVSAVLGAARGATIELYPNQGELWQRYCRSTVGLWVALIVTKVFLLAAASAAGASAGGGTNSLLVSLGASLLAEAAVVGPRALVAEVQSLLAGHRVAPGAGPRPPLEALSDSELRVLRYLPTNLTAPEIAGELYVSRNTVKTHMRNLYAKLGTHRRGETVARARALGLLAPSARR